MILVVDDDLHIQRMYKEKFEEEGYEVVIASNGKEAIELFERAVPDLVTISLHSTYSCLMLTVSVS